MCKHFLRNAELTAISTPLTEELSSGMLRKRYQQSALSY